ncbi:MAG: MATE family efflux transporter [Eubacteriales bacterium]|nr:MATE family efflux transporter [Eubacteriales bacterium]
MQIKLSDHFTYGKLLRFVLPCVVMMVVTSLYTVIDGFFVSNFAGKTAFAAVNLIWPFLQLVSAAGFMFGSGGSALVAFMLGQGKEKKADETFTMLMMVLAVLGAAVSAAGFVFMPQIAVFLGAGEHLVDDCVLYGRILICANPLFMMQNAYQSFLVTAERPRLGLGISIMAGVINAALDFLLVAVFPLGIWGAGLATAFSQIMGGLVPTIYFMSRKNKSRLHFVRTKLDMRDLVRSCANGSSEMMTNLSGAVVSLLYNYQLLYLAAENGVAAYGAIMYVGFMFTAFHFGYAIGCNPIVGYNYGANNTGELQNVLKKSLTLTCLVGVAMTMLAETMAGVIASVYVGYDQVLREMTAWGMRIFGLSFLLNGFNIFASAFFTGLNNGAVSALISFLRTLVIQVAAVLILPVYLGINGVWLAVVAAEGCTLLVTAVLFAANRKKYQYY